MINDQPCGIRASGLVWFHTCVWKGMNGLSALTLKHVKKSLPIRGIDLTGLTDFILINVLNLNVCVITFRLLTLAGSNLASSAKSRKNVYTPKFIVHSQATFIPNILGDC